MKKTAVMLLAALVAGSAQAQELSVEQENELRDIGQQYNRKASMIEDMIQGKLTDLELELTREGRLATEKEAKAASDHVNEILKDVSKLYGEFIRSQVAYMLDSKNVLTMEQRLHVLAQLEPDQLLNYEDVEYLQPELFDLPIDLDLDLDQRKKLARLEADLVIEEVKLELDIELVMLELEAIFTADEVDTDQVDKQVMKLADLAAKAIENRVDYFIDAKDVLTLDQKRLLAQLIGL